MKMAGKKDLIWKIGSFMVGVTLISKGSCRKMIGKGKLSDCKCLMWGEITAMRVSKNN